jgi:hypothetical protein
MGELSEYKIFVIKVERKKLQKCKHTWNYNIEMDLRKTGCRDTDWLEMGSYCGHL